MQHSAPDQLIQQVAPVLSDTDGQTSLLAGSDRHVLGVLREAFPRARCHRTPRPRETLAWRTAGWSGTLCRSLLGLDVSLLEVVGVGLTTCEGEGVVKRVHKPFSAECTGSLRPLKEVDEVREEVQEIKNE